MNEISYETSIHNFNKRSKYLEYMKQSSKCSWKALEYLPSNPQYKIWDKRSTWYYNQALEIEKQIVK